MRLQGFTQLLNKAAHLREQRQLYLETCQVLQSQVVTLESEKTTAVISLDRVFLAALFAVWFMEGFGFYYGTRKVEHLVASLASGAQELAQKHRETLPPATIDALRETAGVCNQVIYILGKVSHHGEVKSLKQLRRIIWVPKL